MSQQGKIDPRTLSDADIEGHVRTFVADAADCDVAEVGCDTNIYVDLGVDSLGIVAIFIDVSYTFGVPEPAIEEDYKRLETVAKIVSYIRLHCNG